MSRAHVHPCSKCGAFVRCTAPLDSGSYDSDGSMHCVNEHPDRNVFLCEDCGWQAEHDAHDDHEEDDAA